MRLQMVAAPDAVHCSRADILRRRHRTYAPMNCIHRLSAQSRLDDRGLPFRRDGLRTAAAWMILQNADNAL